MANANTGVLLLNLGTPDAPTPDKVRTYLAQFLADPLVIDIPALFRWILVNILILPRRAHTSAEAYRKVWTERGSPLRFHTEDTAAGVRKILGPEFQVEFGMRYGNPSIESALKAMPLDQLKRLLVFPLYPQYSLAATESSVLEVKRVMRKLGVKIEPKFLPAFYNRSEFLGAFESVIRDATATQPFDHLLFSFHGLPERHVRKTDRSPDQSYCLASAQCCDQITDVNRDCYRAQCFATAKDLAQRLSLPEDKYSVCFQSRLGSTPWIQPYTDELYLELPKRGIKRLAVACPAFVADCLETSEEVAIRGRETFLAAGGTDFYLIPSLNSSQVWIKAIAQWAQQGG